MTLGRYRIVRGKRPPGDPLPEGIRQDTRKHTKHVLRPDSHDVRRYLDEPGEAAWRRFAATWRTRVEERFATDPGPFEALAEQAREADVWLGCSCPTQKNPDVRRCHTILALEFMSEKFGWLEIDWPSQTQ